MTSISRLPLQKDSAWSYLKIHSGIFAVLVGVLFVYIPVLINFPLRSTGDEKVYVAQALEMHAQGRWFLQTWAGEANYYKGPMFYWLLRLGFILFGAQNPLAISYMNLAGILIAAWAMGRLLLQTMQDRGAAMIAAASLALSSGVFAHALASQMEALLVVFYALTAVAVFRQRSLLAWLLIGMAGWLKSPLHAVLLGCSTLLYWAMIGELRAKAQQRREWFNLLGGLVFGASAYLPSYLFDQQAFLASYVQRETLAKGANGVGAFAATWPLVFVHFLPWAFLLLTWVLPGNVKWVGRASSLKLTERRLVKLAFAWLIPIVGFFALHQYRSSIYILPALPALSILAALAWVRSASDRRWLFYGIALLFSFIGALLAIIIWRFTPLPPWWDGRSTAIILSGIFAASAFCLAVTLVHGSLARAWSMLICAVCFFVGTGQLLSVLGKHEVVDVHGFSEKYAIDRPWVRLNLNQHLWSEWGLLNSMLGHTVVGVHRTRDLAAYMVPGTVFLVPDQQQLQQLQQASQLHENLFLATQTWRRWLIHGRLPNGEFAWQTAWRERNLAPLEREEFIVVVQKDKPLISGTISTH